MNSSTEEYQAGYQDGFSDATRKAVCVLFAAHQDSARLREALKVIKRRAKTPGIGFDVINTLNAIETIAGAAMQEQPAQEKK